MLVIVTLVLWCEIPPVALTVPDSKREDIYQFRTLDTLKENQLTFVNKYNSNLQHAKDAFNVIDKPFFNIELDQVCVPGLHLTLGVYFKRFNYFELLCKDVDMQISYALAEGASITVHSFTLGGPLFFEQEDSSALVQWISSANFRHGS